MADIGHVRALPKVNVSLPKQAYDLLCTASLLHPRTLSSPIRGKRILSQDLAQDLGRASIGSGKFNTGLSATWAEGDSNYDGYADVLDLADFMSSGLFNAGSYNTPAGTIAAVPEPSTIGLLGVGAGIAGLVAARRKRAI